MNARSRTARRTLRDRTRTQRAAARIARQEAGTPTVAADTRDDDFCTGCHHDHAPAVCGYNPANDYSAYNDAA